MSELRPFRALRYARDPGPRIAPPYDVISAAERAALAAEPENIVHLTLPPGREGARDYSAAAQTFARWLRQGVLVRDPEPRLYVLEERIPDGRVRRGFLGQLRLADYEERVVLPHERTMSGPKHDRLLLTRAVAANLEPLLFLYEDREALLAPLLRPSAPTLMECRGPDGGQLALHAGPAGDGVAQVRSRLADRSVIIADGHHRYETMLAYRDECRRSGGDAGRNDPHEFVLAYFVNAFDPGSRIDAIHRVLEGEVADAGAALEGAGFRLEERSETTAEPLLKLLEQRRKGAHALVLVRPTGRCLLASRARDAELDVEVLHAEVLPAIGGALSFDARADRVIERVRSSDAALGILMNPLDPDELFRVVQAGRVLPQKSTFFSPKVPSGLVVRDLGTD